MAFPMGKKTSPTDRLVARTTISKMAYPLIVPPALFSEIRRRFSHVFALFRIYTVYRYSSLSFEVCCGGEIGSHGIDQSPRSKVGHEKGMKMR